MWSQIGQFHIISFIFVYKELPLKLRRHKNWSLILSRQKTENFETLANEHIYVLFFKGENKIQERKERKRERERERERERKVEGQSEEIEYDPVNKKNIEATTSQKRKQNQLSSNEFFSNDRSSVGFRYN